MNWVLLKMMKTRGQSVSTGIRDIFIYIKIKAFIWTQENPLILVPQKICGKLVVYAFQRTRTCIFMNALRSFLIEYPSHECSTHWIFKKQTSIEISNKLFMPLYLNALQPASSSTFALLSKKGDILLIE